MGIVTAGGALGQGVMSFTAESLIADAGWRRAFVVIGVTVLDLQAIIRSK